MKVRWFFIITMTFLFDFDYKKDGLKYLKEVKKILEWDGKYPTRVYMGDNYHNMREITEKLSVND